jgi:hypothetical protein
VQVDSNENPSLKCAWFQRLPLKCDEPLSNVAFNFNVRHYNVATGNDDFDTFSYLLTRRTVCHLWWGGAG